MDRVHSVSLRFLPVEGSWGAAAGMGGMCDPSLGSSCGRVWRLDYRAKELIVCVYGFYLESGWSLDSGYG